MPNPMPDADTHVRSLRTAARTAGLDAGLVHLPDRRGVLVGDHRLNLFDWGPPTAALPIVADADTHNARPLADGRWTWKYDQRHFGRSGRRPDPDSFRRLWDGVDRLDLPALVVRGVDSRMLDAAGAADLADHLPQGRWAEIPEAGHTVHGDNPSAFIAALSTFPGTIP